MDPIESGGKTPLSSQIRIEIGILSSFAWNPVVDKLFLYDDTATPN
ncbi:MAG: hypothetical protein AAF939_05365 [Planctomycetota bacterium]